MARLLSVGFLLLLFTPVARAQWIAQASQPDVFGNRTVNAAAVAPSGDGLAIQCNQKDTLKLAYIFPVTSSEMDEMATAGPLPVTLLVKVDKGNVMKLPAKMEPWNDKYAGFVASGRDYDVVKAIKSIGAAEESIGVGVDFLGHQQSDNFSPSGSTAAMDTIISDCKLASIKPDPSNTQSKP